MMYRCSSGSRSSRKAWPRSTFSAPRKRSITLSPRCAIAAPTLADVCLRVERDANPSRRELAGYLAVGKHLGLRPDESASCAHHFGLGAQTLDLGGVHRPDQAGEDVDRRDRFLLDLVVAER